MSCKKCSAPSPGVYDAEFRISPSQEESVKCALCDNLLCSPRKSCVDHKSAPTLFGQLKREQHLSGVGGVDMGVHHQATPHVFLVQSTNIY
jgi:hypothetical protein